MPSEHLGMYLLRAADFIRGMNLMREDESYSNSSALLAIHSAVSYSDALRIGLGDHELSADDHRNAASALKRLLTARQLSDQTGLGHLHFLVSKKSLVAYGDRPLDAKDCRTLITKAERFARWANNVGAQLRIEGWKHDSD